MEQSVVDRRYSRKSHGNNAFDAINRSTEHNPPDAGLSAEALKSPFRALTAVRCYVVANVPKEAADRVDAMGRILPVDAESFDDLDATFASLGAQSMTTTGQPAV